MTSIHVYLENTTQYPDGSYPANPSTAGNFYFMYEGVKHIVPLSMHPFSIISASRLDTRIKEICGSPTHVTAHWSGLPSGGLDNTWEV